MTFGLLPKVLGIEFGALACKACALGAIFLLRERDILFWSYNWQCSGITHVSALDPGLKGISYVQGPN